MTRLRPDVGWYFAGLAAGEGSFQIVHGKKTSLQCHFTMHLRADDREILVTIPSRGVAEVAA